MVLRSKDAARPAHFFMVCAKTVSFSASQIQSTISTMHYFCIRKTYQERAHLTMSQRRRREHTIQRRRKKGILKCMESRLWLCSSQFGDFIEFSWLHISQDTFCCCCCCCWAAILFPCFQLYIPVWRLHFVECRWSWIFFDAGNIIFSCQECWTRDAFHTC